MFGPEEEVEVNPVGIFLAAILIVVAFVGGVNVGKTDTTPYVNRMNAQAKAFTDLTAKYETLQCSTRGLDLTTVKGITLCMDRQTKALHKIDSVAD